MPKILLKIIAVLVGLATLLYLLGRQFSVWEIDAVKQLKNKDASSPQQDDSLPSSIPPAFTDDLKKIKGIGKVIEEKLNRIGYYRLEQIASLDEAEIERIEEEISFPGRIARDAWVAQAKALLS
jgi:predicted flap endonuclease-1-like 5' DNA nuclease